MEPMLLMLMQVLFYGLHPDLYLEVDPKNKGPLMCLINTVSFSVLGKPLSSGQALSFKGLTLEYSVVKSPIFFMNIKQDIINPIPTAKIKSQNVDKISTTSIINTSELTLSGPKERSRKTSETVSTRTELGPD